MSSLAFQSKNSPRSKKISRKWVVWGVLILAIFGLAGGWIARSMMKAGIMPALIFTDVEQGTLTKYISANGTVTPVIWVSVGTQVSGIVKDLLVDFNSKVKKGQILLRLDDVNLKAQLTQDEANLLSAEASRDLALANLKRYQALFKLNYVTKQELEQMVQQYKASLAGVALIRAQIIRDKQNLEYATIISPIDGVVTDRQVDVGQTVAASYQTPVLFKVAKDLKDMEILASVSEADLGLLQKGQPASFTVDAFGDREYKGVVDDIRLNPTTVSNVVTYTVVVLVKNDDLSLLPGMTANLSMKVAVHPDAVLVNNAALRYKPSEAMQKFLARSKDATGDGKLADNNSVGIAYRVLDDKLVPTRIKLGLTDSKVTEILSSNLKPGDKLVQSEVEYNSSNSSNFRMRLF